VSRAGKRVPPKGFRGVRSKPDPEPTPPNELLMAVKAFEIAAQEADRWQRLFRLEMSEHNAEGYVRAWKMLIECRRTLDSCVLAPTDFVSFAR